MNYLKNIFLITSAWILILAQHSFAQNREHSEIKVLTQNIWGLPAILVKNKKFRLKKFCEILKQRSHTTGAWDIVLIQELWMFKDQQSLKNCGYPYFTALDTSSLDSGLMTLSKFPILAEFKHQFKNRYDNSHLDAERFAYKSAIFTVVQHPSLGPTWVINTHLAAGNRRFTNDPLRSAQLLEIREKLNELNPDLPILFGGDVNTSEKVSDESWNILKTQFSEFQEATNICDVPTSEHRTPFELVDHIFSNQALKPKCGNVSLDKKIRLKTRKLISLSDHLGWETTFVQELAQD